jgi:hypothetical protein
MTHGNDGGPPDTLGANPFDGTPSHPHRRRSRPRHEANALATLSVVFAYVFAPVGAFLGHLACALATGQSDVRGVTDIGRCLTGHCYPGASVVQRHYGAWPMETWW